MNAVVLLSGGLDSQVLLANERPNYEYVHCLGFDYGQKHIRELRSAKQIAHYYGATFQEIKIPKLTGSALTDWGMEIPSGHYADPKQSATIVPGRNLIFLSIAASVAQSLRSNGNSRKAEVVLFAAHKGDSFIYPDCRPEFVEAANKAMQLAYLTSVKAPFLEKTKKEVVQLGKLISVPFEDSWSCYEGGERPCGRCGACNERTESFS